MKLKTLLLGLTFALFCSVGFSQSKVKTEKLKQAPQDKQTEQKVKVAKEGLVKKEMHQISPQLKKTAKTKHVPIADSPPPIYKITILDEKSDIKGNVAPKKNTKLKKK